MTESSSHSERDSSTKPISISDQDSFEAFISKDRPVLVDLYADWCGPCQQMTPKIEELAKQYEGAVAKVNVDNAPQIASRYNVSSIPTFLIFENSELQERLIGVQVLEKLEKHVQ